MVPPGLRTWFVIHFVVDVVIAVPLMVAPAFTLSLLGWEAVDPFATRLFAASLLGIGIESLLGRDAPVEAYRAMLNLKIIFSGSAILGILITMSAGGPPLGGVFLGVFIVFCAVWVTYRLRLRLEAEGPTR